MTKPLRIRLVIDPARARIWHRNLAEALTKQGHNVAIEVRSGATPPPYAATILLSLERLVYGLNPQAAGTEWKTLQSARASSETPDLILDMSGQTDSSPVRTLQPVYARALVEEAAMAALLDGRMPEIGILDSLEPTAFLFHAAFERPRVLSKSLDNLGARLTTIFVNAVADIAAGRPLQGHRGIITFSPNLQIMTALIARARAALTSLSSKTPHWFVGWRAAKDDLISETLRMPEGGWNPLPDDGARFYADPFVFHHKGRTWLFVEEFQYAVGRALISVVELGAQGPIGTPRAVVARPHHLSYPFVFERDGEIWMLAEMSSARRVELQRAVHFPYDWEPAHCLIEGQEVSDATLVEHQNRLWLFGTVGEGGASSWDALHLWHAPKLTGEWRAHPRNPVLTDAASARPAGALFRSDGKLWRPAQDCTRGYGSGLTLARVTRLDEEAFAQEVATTLYPGPSWPGIGLHTLNAAAGFEVIDGASAGRS